MENRQPNINIGILSVFKIALVGLLLVALYFLRDLVLVILTSIVIASFVELMINKFPKKVPRTFSVVIIYVLTAGILLGLFYIFVPVFLEEVSNVAALLSDYLPSTSFIQHLQSGTLEGAKQIASEIGKNISITALIQDIRNFVSGFSGGFVETLTVVFGGALNLLFIIVISFYLSIEERGIENFLRIIIPHSYEDYAVSLWQKAQRKIALWVQGQFVLSLLVGILTYLGLVILGVKYALLLAVASALFELIPFGIILAVIPALFFAYVGGGLTQALWVGGLYLIIQQFESYLLQPLVIKKIVGVSPLVVIISLLIGAKLAGFWGVILAVPMAVAILELIEDLEKHKVPLKHEA